MDPHRFLVAALASLAIVGAGCGDSADPEPPPALTTSTDAISEADAVARAEAAAAERGFSTEGLELKPNQLFGEWQVSFEPADRETLSGGFLVILSAESGELLDVVAYR